VKRRTGKTLIRFNEEIVAARFTDGRWHTETAKGSTDVADVFICATGFLHKPLLPDIAGHELRDVAARPGQRLGDLHATGAEMDSNFLRSAANIWLTSV
jgi:cation diffusion facilitator CzcD-associated flavoprotein CzcO